MKGESIVALGLSTLHSLDNDDAARQAGIDRKVLPANQTLVDAATQDGLEQAPQQIAIAEAAMPVLREG